MHQPGSAPPSPERFDSTSFSILIVTFLLAFALICYRLHWRRSRQEKFARDDIWMGISVLPLILRFVFIMFSVVYLTASFNRKYWKQDHMSEEEIRRRTLGARMVLAGRVFYAGFLWCIKVCILGWFERVTGRQGRYAVVIDGMFVVLAVTYVAVVISTFAECRPVELYWQIWPDPGKCVKAEAQLVAMGSLNIITDILLIFIPLPIVISARLPVILKFQLVLLFCMSLFVVALTIIRMPLIVSGGILQKMRSLWASAEVIAAAIVANAPMFNTILQEKRTDAVLSTAHGGEESGSKRAGGTRTRGRQRPVTGQNSIGSLTRNGGVGGAGEVGAWIRTERSGSWAEASEYFGRPPPGMLPQEKGREVYNDYHHMT